MAQEQYPWRADWIVNDAPEGLANAVHKSGLAFNLVYEEVNKVGAMGWSVEPTHATEGRLAQLAGELGPDRWLDLLARLGLECYLLWLELGYTDDSPRKVS